MYMQQSIVLRISDEITNIDMVIGSQQYHVGRVFKDRNGFYDARQYNAKYGAREIPGYRKTRSRDDATGRAVCLLIADIAKENVRPAAEGTEASVTA